MNIELLLSAIVAAGLVFWLRSVLGTRHGDERERPNPFTQSALEQRKKEAPAPAAAAAEAEEVRADPDYPHEPELPPNVSIADAAAQAGLNEIARADTEFHVAKFAGAAQDAFALIVEAFADGDRALLKDLLEPQVYAAFDAAIVEREERGEFMSNQIHAVKKAEILMARLDGRTAYVTFRFIAQESCVIRGKDGDILSGNPDRVTEMNDIWTFTRHVSSNDPKWYLHRTQDGDVIEAHKTPVPDMK